MGWRTLAKEVALAGFFTALCVPLQSAPVYLPAAGMLLSPLSTLPVLLATLLSRRGGVMTWLCSALILLFISPQEAAILLCATGLLGLVLGRTARRGAACSAILSGGALFFGILALVHVAGIAVFGPRAGAFPLYVAMLFALFFSMAYAFLWAVIVRKLFRRLIKDIHNA